MGEELDRLKEMIAAEDQAVVVERPIRMINPEEREISATDHINKSLLNSFKLMLDNQTFPLEIENDELEASVEEEA